MKILSALLTFLTIVVKMSVVFPFPDRKTFTDLQFKILENSKGSGGIVIFGTSYDYRIVKKIYENVLDEDIVKECGRELYSKDGMRDMVRCHMLLDEIIHSNYNQGNNKDKCNRMVI